MDHLLLTVTVLCWTTSIAPGHTQKNCSSEKRCKCIKLADQTWKAICSDLALYQFPTFQEDVSEINLNNNSIRHWNATRQFPLHLRELSMQKNTLFFYGISDLSFIKDLINLRVLDVSDNVDYERDMGYPAKDFRLLKNLTALYIDGLRLGNFSANEWNLTSLTNLTMVDHCFFDRLGKGFFSGLPNLEYLVINACPLLKTIDEGVFNILHNLHTLDLSSNEHLKFAPFKNVSLDLQSTKIQIMKAKKVHCTFGIGNLLRKDHFRNFQNTTITEMDLSSNRIEMMEKDVPKYLPSNLTILNVSDNQFTWGLYMLAYPFLSNLRIADASLQYSYSFKNINEMGCENSLDCDDATSESLTFPGDASDHHHAILSRKINISVYVPCKLEKIFFHSSKFYFNIGEVHVSNNHIKEYHVQNNFFYSLMGPMYGMEYAEYLDFSRNFVKNISEHFFDTFPNLTYLDLSKNLLGNCLNAMVQYDHFKTLQKLVEIRLSSNEISTLPSKLLSNAFSLNTLDLSHNLISNFTFTLSDKSPLKILDLSNNRLRDVSRETINRLEDKHRQFNLTLDLSGNLLDCSCDTIPFIHWIRDSNINFQNKNSYQCKMSHNRKRTFSELTSILNELGNECSSNAASMTIGITMTVVAVLIVGITTLLYRFRWTIRYFFYLTKWEIQEIVGPKKQKRQKDFEYSAFVTYSENDSNFAEIEMVHHLEEEGALKICLPNRDFSPNVRTYGSITRAIHNSKKIICIVTEAFLEDRWCMYQLQMAEEDRVHREDSDCIVFIFFSPPSEEDLRGVDRSLFLVSLIEQRSYALFPKIEAERALFWQKLVDVLK